MTAKDFLKGLFAPKQIPIGGLAYLDYYFYEPLSSVSHTVNVLTEAAPNSNLYLQLYESNIGSIHQYYGLQTTNGRAIFSAFELTNSDDVRCGPGSFKLASDDEGNYVSVRHDFGHLPVGQYKTEMKRAEQEGNHDWFDYYVTLPDGKRHHVGGIRFPRTDAAEPAMLEPFGGTWLEFWDNSQGNSYVVPVPEWSVEVSVSSDGADDCAINEKYSARADGLSMPQALISHPSPDFVRIDVGESVSRDS